MRADWQLPRLHFSDRYQLVDATPEGLAHIAQHLREADREELYASTGAREYEHILRCSAAGSDSVVMALADGAPAALFGVSTVSLIYNVGCPWMLATDEAFHHQRSLVRGGRLYIATMLEQYARLENWVDARNHRAVAWLRHSGLNLDEPEPYGPLQLPFHRFWIER